MQYLKRDYLYYYWRKVYKILKVEAYIYWEKIYSLVVGENCYNM